MNLYDLKTNNRQENRNIDEKTPVFSWKIEGTESEIFQKKYRILVYTEEKKQMWDSGLISSSKITDIVYEGETLQSDTRYIWNVESIVKCGEKEICLKSEDTFFETAFLEESDWKGTFLGETEDFQYHLYRKNFQTEAIIKRAKLYICGLGHAECWLNGKRVSEYVLEPGWTNYDKTCLYTSYDVTELLNKEKNTILVKPGDGMYNVPGGRYVYNTRSYGKCKFLLQLCLTDEQGNKQYVVSDDTWKMTESPVKFCCIYGGEDYDGNFWKEEYLYPEYEENHDWKKAVCAEWPKGRLRAMPMESVKAMEIYDAAKVFPLTEKKWLYDFGKNFSGWVRIKIKTNGKMAGQKIVLSPKELLGKDGGMSTGAWDSYAWTYILNEKLEQEFVPDFTYTGFRYVEMTGAVPQEMLSDQKSAGSDGDGEMPVILSAKGEFLYPELDVAGKFECSNELFNQIHEIILQSIKSNTKSYFTDCPQREKLGWLEQTHLIGPSIMYNLNVQNLYAKIEQDMADSQRENGLIPDIAPEYVTGFEKWHWGFLDSPEWGSACVIAPWYAYLRYGNSDVLRKHYEVMKKYVSYLDGKTHHEMLHHGLGDWLDIGPCTPHSQNTPVPVVASAIWYYVLGIMEKIAGLLGKEADAAGYREKKRIVFEEYNAQFLDDQTGRYATGSQAAQAMSLVAGLVPEEMKEKVLKQLRLDIEKRNYAITAGDVGHPFLVAALMKYQMNDLLDKMTNITDTPGYGYHIVCKATTLTEEWDGPNPENPHASQNHLMLGSIEEWFYAGLGGIDLIRSSKAFDEISICPQPVDSVNWCKVRVQHPYGEISVQWEKKEENVSVNVIIPPNLRAHLKTPDGKTVKCVGSGSHSYEYKGK